MAIELNDNIEVLAPKPSDPRNLTETNELYASVAAANLAIPITRRCLRLPVNLVDGEYWYRDGIEDTDLILKTDDTKAPINNPTFTGNVVVPDATSDNEAVNLGQLNSVQITVTVGEEFYYDENDILRPNISTYRQIELNNTSPIPIITLDFEPTFIQSVNVNGVILTQNQYIYTAPNQLDLSGYIPAVTPMTIEIIYDHFIITNEIL